MLHDPHKRQRRPWPGGAGVAVLDDQRRAQADGTAAAVELPSLQPAANRRRPPFAREIEQALAAGQALNVFVFAGEGAWDRAAARRFAHGPGSALVVPEDTTPEAIAWPPLGSCCLAADRIDRQAAVRIGQALVSSGTRLVVVLGHNLLVRQPRAAA